MKKQPLINFIKLKNDWTICMPGGYEPFQKENDVITLDGDYDIIGVFVFKEDSVIVKKTDWQVEPKIYFNKKQIDLQIPLEEDEE